MKECEDNANITKEILVYQIARQTRMIPSDIKITVDLLFEIMGENLKIGNDIEIRGFGSWRIRTMGARIARMPKHDGKKWKGKSPLAKTEPLAIPPKKRVKFKPSPSIKYEVDKIQLSKDELERVTNGSWDRNKRWSKSNA